MTNKFFSIMEAIGRDILKVWADVVKYLPPAAALAALIFPQSAPAAAGVVSAVDLIQQAVATVEQKFAAAGAPTGTGPQKLAQVLSIVGPTVTKLLADEGVQVDQARLTGIINAVVAVLNVQAGPATA
jgi:hypothetical protein